MQRALILQNNGVIGADELILDDETAILPAQSAAGQTIAVESWAYDPAIDIHEAGSLGEGVRSAEEKLFCKCSATPRSRKATAAKLGISPRTLRYKIARMKEAGGGCAWLGVLAWKMLA